MRIEGGLSMVEAIMGGGKTLFEVQSGIKHMLKGGDWVTNVPLYGHGPLSHKPDALYTVARRICPLNGSKRYAVHQNLLRRYFYEEDLETALTHAAHPSIRKPGQAFIRLGWDEALSDLNSREWAGGRGKTADDRNNLFERIPMLRKSSVACFLLVQHSELLDKNARRVCNWYVRVQNQSETQRWRGIRVSKGMPALFLAFWYQGNKAEKADKAIKPAVTQRYFRGYYGNLYDTLGLYGITAADAASGRIIWHGGPEGADARHERPALSPPPSPALMPSSSALPSDLFDTVDA